jgi:hypothetical protein
MDKLGNIIAEYLPENVSHIIKISAVYKYVVGERIWKVSKPVKYDGKILTVAVFDNIWIQELSFLKQDIINKLKSEGANVSDIKFVHRFKPLTQEKKFYKRAVTEKEMVFVDRFSSFIKDDSLRQSYRKALTSYFQRYSLRDFFLE